MHERYLTLQEACDQFFGGKVTPASLRAEARRGRLHISRVGRVDFVSVAAIQEMMALGRPYAAPPVGPLKQHDEARVRAAQKSAMRAADQLKRIPRKHS